MERHVLEVSCRSSERIEPRLLRWTGEGDQQGRTGRRTEGERKANGRRTDGSGLTSKKMNAVATQIRVPANTAARMRLETGASGFGAGARGLDGMS